MGPTTIERYEMKYRIPSRLVALVRNRIKQFCVPDRAGDEGRYLISSLYVDSPGRRLYYDTVDRVTKRYKLRIRRYVGSPAFVEIKRRVKTIVQKSRCAIRADLWPAVFHDPRRLDEAGLSEESRRTVVEFTNKCLNLGAEPAALVRYEREAWVSTCDEYARVTFDRRLVAARPQGWTVPVEAPVGWQPIDLPGRFGLPESGVVLELKATMEVPFWMTDLVGDLGLRRVGFSKYGSSIDFLERVPWAATREPSRRMMRRVP